MEKKKATKQGYFTHNITTTVNAQKKRRKIKYGSPLWRRDSTNRLQRKPLRKSTSFESALNVVSSSDPLVTFEKDTEYQSTRFNNSNTHLEGDVSTHRQPKKIFNSTMNNDFYLNSDSGRYITSDTLFRRGTEIQKYTRNNHSGKLRISNIWIDWTPFWRRNDESKRLDRRHHTSDFI